MAYNEPTVRMYNSQNDQLADVPQRIAAKMLKFNHVSEGGVWCLESEMKKYFDLEEINPTEASDVKPLPDLMLPKKGTPKAAAKVTKAAKPVQVAKPKPVKKVQTQSPKGLEGLGVSELRAMAVKKLGMEEAEAKTYKKDELIEALSKKK